MEKEEETPFSQVLKETSEEQIKWLMKMFTLPYLSMEQLGLMSEKEALRVLLSEAGLKNGADFERELCEMYDVCKYSIVNVMGTLDKEILRRFKSTK